MQQSQNGVTIHFGIRHNTDRRQIKDFVKRDGPALHFLIDTKEMLGTSIDLSRQPCVQKGLLSQVNQGLNILLTLLILFSQP